MRPLILLAVAAVAAGATNLLRPNPIPWAEDWSHRVERQALELGLRVADVDQANRIIDEGMYFIFDARPPEQFDEGHLPTAMSLPSDGFADRFLEYVGMLIPEQPILVYCSGQVCDESLLVSNELIAQGYTNVVLFAGGYEDWTAAGLPVEGGY